MGNTLEDLDRSFDLALRAANKSPRTRETYSAAIRLLASWLNEQGCSTDVSEIRRDQIAGFIANLLDQGNKPATASNRFRALKTFFRWAAAEGEIAHSLMDIMKPPRVPVEPVSILSDDAVRRLLDACKGNDVVDRRDTAIIRLLIDSGLRRAEISGLTVDDVDLERQVATVTGKGSKRRDCPFGPKTAMAMDRYLRARKTHPYHESKALWLGKYGPLTHWGIDEIVRGRAAEAGIGPVHLHQFRHLWTHLCKSAGMQEADIMENAGWSSRQMLDRYAKSQAAERARAAHQRLAPGDRF